MIKAINLRNKNKFKTIAIFIIFSVSGLFLFVYGNDVIRTDFELEDFTFLEQNMTYKEIVDTVGFEGEFVGSGFMIIKYPLANDEEVLLNFMGNDNGLQWATYCSKDGKTRKLILEKKESK